MNLYNDDLENDLIKKQIFSNLSPEVIIEAIKLQAATLFGEAIEVNQLEAFDEKIMDLKEENINNDDFLRDLDKQKYDVYTSVLDDVSNRYGITVDIDNMAFESTVKILYDFFIYNYRAHLVALMTGYILKNRKDLQRTYSDTEKKDIRITKGRRDFKDTKDAYILSNIYAIIESIANSDIDNEDFMKYMIHYANTPTIHSMQKFTVRTGLVSSDSGNLYSDFIQQFLNTYNLNVGSIVNDVAEALTESFPKN